MIIYDQNSIYIKNYKSIRYVDENHISIELSDYNLSILGECFEIVYYDFNELKMKGKIRVIECHDARI